MDILTHFKRAFLTAIMLCMIATLSGCGESYNLQTGLTDSDANEIMAVLNREGIEVQKVSGKEGVTLVVKSTDIARATNAMHAAGLPRKNLSDLGQVFKKDGMISTPMEERIRYIHGLSEELEYTLQQFDHVVSARVHVVLPERVAPGEPIQPSSAAVFIKYTPPMDEDAMIPRVRNLVASSIPGLSGEDSRDKVTVVLAPGEPAPAPVEWTKVGPFMVQAGSAGSLQGMLSLAAVVALLSLAGAGFLLYKHPPQLLLDFIAKRKAGKAESEETEAEAEPEAEEVEA